MSLDLSALSHAWTSLTAQVGELRLLRHEDDYQNAVELLDALLDATHGEADHPLAGLVELVAGFIEQYESKQLGEHQSQPFEVLRLLMESNGLRQIDLAKDLGGQSVVSQILSGRRQINARQASVLGERFGISPAVFLPRQAHESAEIRTEVLTVSTIEASGELADLDVAMTTTLLEDIGGNEGMPFPTTWFEECGVPQNFYRC